MEDVPLPRAASPRPRSRVRTNSCASNVVLEPIGAALDPLSTSPTASPEARMPPPPLPAAATPLNPNTPCSEAAVHAVADQKEGKEDPSETRPSRSASTASRSNRLSLTLPIAPPTAFPSRPAPASSAASSFPPTPVDVSAGLASPAGPADFITAIAAQERRVLELREELSRAEFSLGKLKRQWANHEAQKKRAEIRRTEPMRTMAAKPGSAATTTDASATSADDNDNAATATATVTRTTELDRRRSLLLAGQQQPGSDPNTPTQSRRRVFRGGHARTLSLLSPTKSSSGTFSVHEDQTDDGSVKSPTATSTSTSPHEPDSPFYQNLQNLGRYAPTAASHLSKRASWAPQSVHQVAGLKQVAGDLTATLWTFVEDLRQATVGDEPITGGSAAMRSFDANTRPISNDDLQSTIRASANAPARPHVARAFTMDLPATPTPAGRQLATAGTASATTEQQSSTLKEKPTAATNAAGGSSSNGSNGSNGKAKGTKMAKQADAKANKRFSFTGLTVDAYDDNDWSSWDSPTVKSPRWSGSTVSGDSAVTSIPEQADENATPQKNGNGTPSSPSAFSTDRPANDMAWPAALNRLTPGNLRRTATDLVKEWEKSLSRPLAVAVDTDGTVQGRSS
ncbi:hypothetical protein SPI_03082 [Niveomyces insectorum RCEF 264]|uniref:DUF4048 domain-containing protein n=1 Tax=Niveomyces insectorum RCEF 264 TaxID=1081102 RepID=A0A167X1Z1_9HYPO|nr:hypothetical protein SPI_03082 [Niveomyces insectorum RCEF 264]